MKLRTLRQLAREQRRTRRASPPPDAGDLDRGDLYQLAHGRSGPVADALRRALAREGER